MSNQEIKIIQDSKRSFEQDVNYWLGREWHLHGDVEIIKYGVGTDPWGGIVYELLFIQVLKKETNE